MANPSVNMEHPLIMCRSPPKSERKSVKTISFVVFLKIIHDSPSYEPPFIYPIVECEILHLRVPWMVV